MGLAAFINLLQPAPHLPEMTDPKRVQKEFRYWRLRIFYSMYIGYLFFYFTRKSFNSILPIINKDLGLTISDIGWITTTLSIAYGVSKFTSGVLCDRSNPRYFMALGLILTGFCNIFFGCCSTVLGLCLFWGLNGLFQGWGWPACTKQLTHWFSHAERGTWWSVCSTSHNVGGFLIPYLAAPVALWFGWRYGMWVPGVLCLGVGLWLLNRLRDVPQSLGLPTVEKYRGELPPETEINQDPINTMSVKQILFEQVLNNKYVWVLGMAYFFIYFMRTAVDGFGTIYLTQAKDFTPIQAAGCISWFEVGGFFSVLIAGWGSDNWFGGRRIPLTVISSVLLILAVLGFWYFTPGHYLEASALIAAIGFLIFIPQMLVGLAAAEFVSKKAAGASNGFASCLAHLGAATAGFPLGRITEVWGWYGFVITLAIGSLITFLVLLPMWNVKSKMQEKIQSDQEFSGTEAGALIQDPEV